MSFNCKLINGNWFYFLVEVYYKSVLRASCASKYIDLFLLEMEHAHLEEHNRISATCVLQRFKQ